MKNITEIHMIANIKRNKKYMLTKARKYITLIIHTNSDERSV